MLKKKLGWFLSLIFILPIFFVLFRKNTSSPVKDNSSKEIVTSCFPIYNIVRELLSGVNEFKLTNLTSNYLEENSCLHNYSLTTDNAKSIENALVVIINGANFEPFTDKIPSDKIIDASENINLDEEKNPYVWISIDNYINQIKNISNELSSILPSYKNIIIKNSDNYCAKLSNIKERWSTKFENFKGVKIASFSEKFNYLLKEFNFVPIELRSSHSHESTPSADIISSAVQKIKENNFKFFISAKSDVNTNKVIEKESNVKCVILRSLDNPSDGNYIDQMESNLNKIYEAISS